MNQRDASASDVIRRLQAKIAEIPRISLYMQAVQDLTIDDRVSRTQYQYSLTSPDSHEVAKWTNLLVNHLQHANVLTRCHQRSTKSRLTNQYHH